MTLRFFTALIASWLLAGTAAHAQGFDFDTLTQKARERARQAWQAPANTTPPELARLNYDGMRDIRWRAERALWRDAQLPFEAMFFHLASYHTAPVRIHEVTLSGPQAGVRPLAFRSEDFDYGKNQLDPQAWGDIGFAGFRLHYPLNTTAYKDELAVFQGASYFRALGAGQQYGLSARGLAIDTHGGRGEEFPAFTEFWLVRPEAGAQQVTVLALLESPRATGAYRFDIRPGTDSVMAVRARVFLREGASPMHVLGLAPLTSMYLFGENQPRSGDFRPEVHDSDGLMMVTGDGEWLWRPLQNPRQPIINSFAMTSLRGFGLMQRDRDFRSYEDVEARYERRPSAWVKPVGEWGPGRVELVQLPTPDETHDNIVAYWVPQQLPAAGTPLEFAYELSWQGDAQQRPPGSWATQSRRGVGYTQQDTATLASQVQYVIDFQGPALDTLPPDAAVKAVVTAAGSGRVIEQIAYRNPASPHQKGWRMTVRVQRDNTAQPVELRAFLQHGNDIVSETWTNIILPE